MAHVVINSTGTGAAQTGGGVTTTSGNKNIVLINETDSVITLDIHVGGAHHSPGLVHTIDKKVTLMSPMSELMGLLQCIM